MTKPLQLIRDGWQFVVDSFAAPVPNDQHVAVSLQELEPRLLYDASPLGVLIDQAIDTDAIAEDIDQQLADLIEMCAEEQTSYALACQEPDLAWLDISLTSEMLTPYDLAQQLVVIDERVENLDQLLGDLEADRDVSYQIVTIGSETDAIEQITQLLNRSTPFDAMHIISHGSDGRLQLGNTELNSDNLRSLPAATFQLDDGTGIGCRYPAVWMRCSRQCRRPDVRRSFCRMDRLRRCGQW